jgi:hypothetical protein
VRRSQAPDIKLKSSEAVTRGFRRNQRAGSRRILYFLIPDYSETAPLVDCLRRKRKNCGKNMDPVPDDKLPIRIQKNFPISQCPRVTGK